MGQRLRNACRIGSSARGVTRIAAAIGEDEGLTGEELARLRRANTRGFGAIYGASAQGAIRVTGDRDNRASRAIDRGEAGRRRGQIAGTHIGKAQRGAIDEDALSANVCGRHEALNARQRNRFLGVVINVERVGIEAIIAIAHHADAADDDAVLVNRQAARISGEAQRRALRADQRTTAAHRIEPGRKVRAWQLAELHAEQRPALQPHSGGRRREMFLHDLAGRAGGESVAAAGEIGAGHRLGDGSGSGRHSDALQANAAANRSDAANPIAADNGIGIGPVHLEHGQHIADPVGHRDE